MRPIASGAPAGVLVDAVLPGAAADVEPFAEFRTCWVVGGVRLWWSVDWRGCRGRGGGEVGGDGWALDVSGLPGGLVGALRLRLRQRGHVGGLGGPGECPDENFLLEVVPAWGRVPGRVLAEQAVVLQAGQRSVVREEHTHNRLVLD